jgi:rhodanese-related sulfurtransferase
MATGPWKEQATAQATSARLSASVSDDAPAGDTAAPRAAVSSSLAQIHWVGRFASYWHPADLHAAIVVGKPDVVTVDARWPDAFATEHIPGAINLFARSVDALTTAHLRRDAEYVVYCWNESCHASTLAAERLAALGFRAQELHGGLQGWKRQGFTTERDR